MRTRGLPALLLLGLCACAPQLKPLDPADLLNEDQLGGLPVDDSVAISEEDLKAAVAEGVLASYDWDSASFDISDGRQTASFGHDPDGPRTWFLSLRFPAGPPAGDFEKGALLGIKRGYRADYVAKYAWAARPELALAFSSEGVLVTIESQSMAQFGLETLEQGLQAVRERVQAGTFAEADEALAPWAALGADPDQVAAAQRELTEAKATAAAQQEAAAARVRERTEDVYAKLRRRWESARSVSRRVIVLRDMLYEQAQHAGAEAWGQRELAELPELANAEAEAATTGIATRELLAEIASGHWEAGFWLSEGERIDRDLARGEVDWRAWLGRLQRTGNWTLGEGEFGKAVAKRGYPLAETALVRACAAWCGEEAPRLAEGSILRAACEVVAELLPGKHAGTRGVSGYASYLLYVAATLDAPADDPSQRLESLRWHVADFRGRHDYGAAFADRLQPLVEAAEAASKHDLAERALDLHSRGLPVSAAIVRFREYALQGHPRWPEPRWFSMLAAEAIEARKSGDPLDPIAEARGWILPVVGALVPQIVGSSLDTELDLVFQAGIFPDSPLMTVIGLWPDTGRVRIMSWAQLQAFSGRVLSPQHVLIREDETYLFAPATPAGAGIFAPVEQVEPLDEAVAERFANEQKERVDAAAEAEGAYAPRFAALDAEGRAIAAEGEQFHARMRELDQTWQGPAASQAASDQRVAQAKALRERGLELDARSKALARNRQQLIAEFRKATQESTRVDGAILSAQYALVEGAVQTTVRRALERYAEDLRASPPAQATPAEVEAELAWTRWLFGLESRPALGNLERSAGYLHRRAEILRERIWFGQGPEGIGRRLAAWWDAGQADPQVDEATRQEWLGWVGQEFLVLYTPPEFLRHVLMESDDPNGLLEALPPEEREEVRKIAREVIGRTR